MTFQTSVTPPTWLKSSHNSIILTQAFNNIKYLLFLYQERFTSHFCRLLKFHNIYKSRNNIAKLAILFKSICLIIIYKYKWNRICCM